MKITLLKISTFVLLFALMGAGCDKEEITTVCGVKNPLEKLYWLKDLKTSLEKNTDISSAEIILYKWNDVDYIYVQKSISSAYDFPNSIFDCFGEVKFNCGGNQPVDNCSTFFTEAQKITVLWKK
jgi:hypothetical protein